MMVKPELPGYMRDMEIKHALRRMSPRNRGKVVDDSTHNVKSQSVDES